jgi:hypothetical protein
MLLKGLKDGKPLSVKDSDAALLIKSGDFVEITQEQYRELRDREVSTLGAIARFTGKTKISADVDVEVARRFANRIHTEGVPDVRRGLAKLVELYADGAMISIPKKSKKTGVDYVAAKNQG